MAIKTSIGFCDSTCNLMAGCDGCELWQPDRGIKHCYAGALTDRYGGSKGWPISFDQPKLFLERLEAALKWPDLTGKDRPEKPWLNGQPRVIFLNDMGDTFTASLPLDWLAPAMERIGNSPHIWLFLTKRPQRMNQFFRQLGRVPENCWPGTTITSQATMARARQLLSPDGVCAISNPSLWLSVEPLLAPVELKDVLWEEAGPTWGLGMNPSCIRLVVVGGESGPGARPFNLQWARDIRDDCMEVQTSCFIKQLGAVPIMDEWLWQRDPSVPLLSAANRAVAPANTVPLKYTSRKGEDWSEWPADLRMREFPCDYKA